MKQTSMFGIAGIAAMLALTTAAGAQSINRVTLLDAGSFNEHNSLAAYTTGLSAQSQADVAVVGNANGLVTDDFYRRWRERHPGGGMPSWAPYAVVASGGTSDTVIGRKSSYAGVIHWANVSGGVAAFDADGGTCGTVPHMPSVPPSDPIPFGWDFDWCGTPPHPRQPHHPLGFIGLDGFKTDQPLRALSLVRVDENYASKRLTAVPVEVQIPVWTYMKGEDRPGLTGFNLK